MAGVVFAPDVGRERPQGRASGPNGPRRRRVRLAQYERAFRLFVGALPTLRAQVGEETAQAALDRVQELRAEVRAGRCDVETFVRTVGDELDALVSAAEAAAKAEAERQPVASGPYVGMIREWLAPQTPEARQRRAVAERFRQRQEERQEERRRQEEAQRSKAEPAATARLCSAPVVAPPRQERRESHVARRRSCRTASGAKSKQDDPEPAPPARRRNAALVVTDAFLLVLTPGDRRALGMGVA